MPTDGLTSAQRQAVTHAGGPLLVLGGPGTGKTRTLIARFQWLVQQGAPRKYEWYGAFALFVTLIWLYLELLRLLGKLRSR